MRRPVTPEITGSNPVWVAKIMSKLLKRLEPKNNSWLIGWLSAQFTDCEVIDWYQKSLESFKPSSNKCIVYLDDEEFYQDTARLLRNLRHWTKNFDLSNHVFICKIKKVKAIFDYYKIPCVYEPWFHVIDDCFAYKRLQKPFDLPPVGRSFFCLNRRSTPERLWTITELDRLQLLQHGFVSGKFPQSAYKKPLANYSFLSNIDYDYQSNNIGFERTCYEINNIPVSANVYNSVYITKNVPGAINVSVETNMKPFFPTEKSVLAFAAYRIPIVLAEADRIANLRKQGFDMFDDLVNHNYDFYQKDETKRITQALVDNDYLLRHGLGDARAFEQRLRYNYDHLTNKWFGSKLQELSSSILDKFGP